MGMIAYIFEEVISCRKGVELIIAIFGPPHHTFLRPLSLNPPSSHIIFFPGDSPGILGKSRYCLVNPRTPH